MCNYLWAGCGTQMSKLGFRMLPKDLVSQLSFELIYRTDWWLSFHSSKTSQWKKNVFSWALGDLHKLDWKVTWSQVCRQNKRQMLRLAKTMFIFKDAQIALSRLPSLNCLRESLPLNLLRSVCIGNLTLFWIFCYLPSWHFQSFLIT